MSLKKMLYSSRFLDEIRARIPISEVIGEKLSFDKKKSNISRGDYWACCPFHGEKTPSFHCDNRRGHYYCFGCGEKGDHFRFLMQISNMQFQEAVEYLARKAGLTMPERSVEGAKRAKAISDLYTVMELATNFFKEALQSEEGYKARAYLRQRGLTSEIIEKFRLGYAYNQRDRLKNTLLKQGVTIEQLKECGLVVEKEETGNIYDRFSDRLIFPIEDLQKRIVGFGGRSFNEMALAKYLNSPQTDLFHKGHILYNLSQARQNLKTIVDQKAMPLILVEGYMDVIALSQAGISTCVAPLGTALTEDQLKLIWRYTDEPILCFDGDKAGMKAAYRAMDKALPLLKVSQNLRFILLPEGNDPDDIIRREGKEAFAYYLKNAVTLIDLLWQRETEGKSFSLPEEQAKLEKELQAAIALIEDKTLRYYYSKEIRTRLKDFLYVQTQKVKKNFSFKKRSKEREDTLFVRENDNLHIFNEEGQRPSLREAAILSSLLNHPYLWEDNFETLAQLQFQHPQMRDIHSAMLDIVAMQIPLTSEEMQLKLEEKIKPKDLADMQMRIRQAGMRICTQDMTEVFAQKALKQLLHLHFQSLSLKERLKDIENQLIENPSDEIFTYYLEIKEELEKAENIDPLIEEFNT